MNEKYRVKAIDKFVSKIQALVYELFCNAIVVNACTFETYGRVMHRNWGDDINVFFLCKLFKRKVVVYDYSSLSRRCKKDNYLVVGSTLSLLCNLQSIVWGTGVIDPNQELPAYPKKVLAVRGPLTREYLLQRGIACPEIYGDPALLLPYYYRPQVKKKYKLGIIPHYQDYEHPEVKRLSQSADVVLIKTEGYKNWLDFINQICSCECVVSSSLHGLIVAEAYGIANLWIELYGNLLGGHFKFRDFFSSIHKTINTPYVITSSTTKNNLIECLSFWKQGMICLKPLVASSPFPLHLKYPLQQ